MHSPNLLIRGALLLAVFLATCPLSISRAESPSSYAIEILDVHSTDETLADGSQVVSATILNAGVEWIGHDHPATITVESSDLQTLDPGTIAELAPGEQQDVEIGVRNAPRVADGSLVSATLIWSVAGFSDSEPFTARAGITPYQGTEESLARHQAPAWYEDAKFGIFIHWGIYSVPAWAPVGGTYAEWYWHSMEQKGSPTYRHQLARFGPRANYDDFIPRFTAKRFNAREWVELFKQAGARYFVLVAKHHDGFALFRTSVTRRSSVDMGPHRDLLAELFRADRKYTPEIHPGVYYSLPEWYNPVYQPSGSGRGRSRSHFPGGPPTNYVTGDPVRYTGFRPVTGYVDGYQVPQMMELIDQYHPDILWCDIGGANDSLRVLAHFYTQALTSNPAGVAVDNRCGVAAHDFTTPEYRHPRGTITDKWEESRGIDPHSYGYNSATPAKAYTSAAELVRQLVDVVSKNGNLLLDIGPRADGSIPSVMVERLRGIGRWLRVNGEGIYGTSYWSRASQAGNLRFTVLPSRAFFITSLKRPRNEVIVREPVPIAAGDRVTLLGYRQDLSWSRTPGGLLIHVPPAAQRTGQYAWTFKISWAHP